jgi:hypothetical protein
MALTLEQINQYLVDGQKFSRRFAHCENLVRSQFLGWPSHIQDHPSLELMVRYGSVRFSFDKGNFCGMDLSGLDLNNVNLIQAKMNGAVLNNTILTDADMEAADLRAAVLSGATMMHTNLFQADLRDAVLTDVDLRHTNVFMTDLRGTDLSRAKLINNDEDPTTVKYDPYEASQVRFSDIDEQTKLPLDLLYGFFNQTFYEENWKFYRQNRQKRPALERPAVEHPQSFEDFRQNCEAYLKDLNSKCRDTSNVIVLALPASHVQLRVLGDIDTFITVTLSQLEKAWDAREAERKNGSAIVKINQLMDEFRNGPYR